MHSLDPDRDTPRQQRGDGSTLVLTGGGSYGAYEVGILKALARGLSAGTDHRPLEPSSIVGTSVGAFNAAFLSTQGEVPFHVAVDRLEEVWRFRIADRGRGNGVFRWRLDPSDFLRTLATHPPMAMQRLETDLKVLGEELAWAARRLSVPRPTLLRTLVAGVDLSRWLCLGPFEETIRQSIDFRRLGQSPWNMAITVAAWPGGRLGHFDGSDAIWQRFGADVLRAAVAIPGVFTPVTLGKYRWFDAGTGANTPLGLPVNQGATLLRVIAPFAMDYPEAKLHRAGSAAEVFNVLRNYWTTEIWDNCRNIAFVNHLARALEREPNGAELRRRLEDQGFRLPTQESIGVQLYVPSQPFSLMPSELLDFSEWWIETQIELGFSDAQKQVLFDTEECVPQLAKVSLFEPLGRVRSPFGQGRMTRKDYPTLRMHEVRGLPSDAPPDASPDALSDVVRTPGRDSGSDDHRSRRNGVSK